MASDKLSEAILFLDVYKNKSRIVKYAANHKFSILSDDTDIIQFISNHVKYIKHNSII